jgi:alpha-D-ribose 1-methylphosphonate 5-triphosphate synthase subunit PhnL
MDKHIEVVDLHKTFTMHVLSGKRIVGFKDISFMLGRGRFLGVVGKNGSGKSSLIRCIYRNYDPTSGDIWLYNGNKKLNLAKINDFEMLGIRKNIMGYVSQFFQFIPRITTMDIVIEPLMVKGWKKEDACDRAEELFRLFDISENLWDAFPSTFSGGEKQRINLMRSLIDCPEIMLLDEPTASLDAKNRDIFLDIIRQMKQQKITIIGIFHNETDLEMLADDFLYMKKIDGADMGTVSKPENQEKPGKFVFNLYN